MRSKNALKNIAVYIVYEAIALILGVIFPRFIILTYGSEINGLTSTISRVLSLINLIQAGAVGAAIYQMYKPVADNDFDTQSSIIYSSRKFYNKISIVYFAVAILAGVFYSFYLKNDSLSFAEIFLSFVILAVNGVSVLLFNSICDIYLSPHQKKYLLLIALILEQIVRYSLMAVFLLLKLHFVFIYVAYLAGGAVSISLHLFFYLKNSKGYITSCPSNKNYPIPNRKFLMFSSIGSEIVTASPTVIITTIIGLVYSSVFSIYAMIFTSMKTILNSIQLSFSAIFGNLTKTSSDDKIQKVHSTIELITIILGTVLSSCVAFLIIPFVNLYTSGVSDASYLYNNLAIFVVVYIVFFAFRTSFSYVATVYGLFKDTCYITLFFGAAGILLSIVSVVLWGMPYVMIGLLFNQIGCGIATLIVIKKNISWFKIGRLLVRTAVMVGIAAVSTILYLFLRPNIDTWLLWIIYGLIVFGLSAFVLLIYCLIFEREYLKMIVIYIKNIFIGKRRI